MNSVIHHPEFYNNVKPLLINLQRHDTEVLTYSIHAWSSYSASYHPRNILLNNPNDQSSRWSSGSNNQLQFITIKLDRLAIVQSILFGKYHKVHVCNLKEFKIYGGTHPDNLIEILHAGLRNDSEPELFPLKYRSGNVIFPCKYIKIVPLMAWGANFNFSVWFVELRGIQDPLVVDKIHGDYLSYRENEGVRLCLKFFRQRNYVDAFSALQKYTKMQLEDPILTELHKTLVIEGNFERAERIIEEAAARNFFSDYISDCPYVPLWRRIYPENERESPCMRGGHQMCIDVEDGKIYLMGGWDGSKDLADFWCFDEHTQHWTLISSDTKRQGGPGSRSCHKICLDPLNKQIYVLGRYIDAESRQGASLDSDFYRFDIRKATWHKISSNTADEGGPELIYDHQMCIDNDRGIIYVFGGRTVCLEPSNHIYSGLYAYDSVNNIWTLIRNDDNQPEHAVQLKSRIGHSMLFNPVEKQLIIFAGQRNKDYLSDFYIYHIDTNTVTEVSRDYTKQSGPEAGFTQRATIDPELGEFYVLSGLMREKATAQETVKNSFWVYQLKKEKWVKVCGGENEYKPRNDLPVSEATVPSGNEKPGEKEPAPRFAHQFVYNSKSKKLYLFGGNPGETCNPRQRLDDFWDLILIRPKVGDICRRAKFAIRKQKFSEMCEEGDALQALRYLQVELGKVVDHSQPQESLEFRSLTSTLFQPKHSLKEGKCPPLSIPYGMAFSHSNPSDIHVDFTGNSTLNGEVQSAKHQDYFKHRTQLYETLLTFFPSYMKQPKNDLIDLTPF